MGFWGLLIVLYFVIGLFFSLNNVYNLDGGGMKPTISYCVRFLIAMFLWPLLLINRGFFI